MVVREMYVSTRGVGNQIMQYGQTFRIDYLLVYVSMVSLFGFMMINLVRIVEARFWSTRPPA
jgi:ABC-type nitrate/sulfonate/bicarbonate transport system permease component